MFSVLAPILVELFKYKATTGLKNKIQGTQEELQKAIQEQIAKIMIKFFGGLICTVALGYAMIRLFNLIEAYVNTLMYATEIKVGFLVMILALSTWGLKAIFFDRKLDAIQIPNPPPPIQPEKGPSELNIVQNLMAQFMEGLNQGMAKGGKKKSNHDN